jgi:Flp pilus assembly protein TadD
VNLGDLYRQIGREAEAVKVLRDGSAKATGSADIPHALGLALVRNKKLDEALPLLERAATLAPDVTHYAYVYGVALESAGPPGRGIEVLKRAHDRRPSDCEVLSALVSYCRELGRLDEATEYADRMAKLLPDDPSVRGMLEQLKAERAKAGSAAPALSGPSRKPGG